MVAMSIQSPTSIRESVERKPWTSEARNDVFAFLSKASGVVCAATLLYCLGPAIGMTLVGVSIAVWSSLRSQTACTEDEGGLGGEDCRAALEHSPPHCTNPVWLRSGRVAGPTALATRSVQRQGV
jgi:hypothetical protein